MKACDWYLKTGNGKTGKLHHSSVTQRYRNTFWWTCPMIWLLHHPKSFVQHCTMYNHSHDSSCLECHLPSSSLKIQSSAIPSKFYLHLVPFTKIILTCHKHYIISNFCRTYRYKHQYKSRFMILLLAVKSYFFHGCKCFFSTPSFIYSRAAMQTTQYEETAEWMNKDDCLNID